MDYYNKIKSQFMSNEIYKKVKDYYKNRNDLMTYYNVGKLLIEAQGGESRAKYGDGLIKEYSKRLTNELGKGYSTRNLKLMRKFYLFQKGQTLSAQLSWSHYIELLDLDDINKINYYIKIVEERNLSVRQLRQIIKEKEYERIDENTRLKLILKEKNQIQDYIKHPILIKNNMNIEEITEELLEQLILNDMDSFLTELGQGFCYIKHQYKIKIGDSYNYIDLLLYNIIYNCYVVIELKVTELKNEHVGQIQVYMNYINKNIETLNQNDTIGIIVCKRENKFIMEYCSDSRIYETTYMLVNV